MWLPLAIASSRSLGVPVAIAMRRWWRCGHFSSAASCCHTSSLTRSGAVTSALRITPSWSSSDNAVNVVTVLPAPGRAKTMLSLRS